MQVATPKTLAKGQRPHHHNMPNPHVFNGRIVCVMPPSSPRYRPLDEFRGLLLALMLAGHAVALVTTFGSSELWTQTTTLYNHLPTLMFRFFTHVTAPMFALVMGISVVLASQSQRRKGKSWWAIRWHLLWRALLLIVLQFTLANLAWRLSGFGPLMFSQPLSAWPIWPSHLYFGVLWSLGCSLALATAFVRVPTAWVAAAAGVLLLSPLVYLPLAQPHLAQPHLATLPWALGPLAIPGSWRGDWVLYTPIPWAGFTLLGLCLGRALHTAPALFERLLLPLAGLFGMLAVVLLVTRAALTNNWDVFALLHVSRYPPEPILICYALAMGCLLLRGLSLGHLGPLSAVLQRFGQQPLVFYVGHLFVLVLLVAMLAPAKTLTNALAVAGAAGLIMWALLGLSARLRRHAPVQETLANPAQSG